jgi:hypothetical protein
MLLLNPVEFPELLEQIGHLVRPNEHVPIEATAWSPDVDTTIQVLAEVTVTGGKGKVCSIMNRHGALSIDACRVIGPGWEEAAHAGAVQPWLGLLGPR